MGGAHEEERVGGALAEVTFFVLSYFLPVYP